MKTNLSKPQSQLPDNDLYPLLELRHSDPHRLLGFHPISASEEVLRVWYPGAQTVKCVAPWGTFSLPCVEERGLFEHRGQSQYFRILGSDPKIRELAPKCGNTGTDPYVLEITDAGGTRRLYDPYSFDPQIGDLDLYLHAEGRHWESYQHLGAHICLLYTSPSPRD